MNTRSSILKVAAVTTLAAFSLAPALATIPLASFSQQSSGLPFVYTSGGGLGFGSFTVTANTAVNFIYLAKVGNAPQNVPIAATLTLTGTAEDVPSGSPNSFQPVDFTLQFTATGAGAWGPAGTDLLDMTASGLMEPINFGGQLGGLLGSTSPTITGSDASGGNMTVYSTNTSGATSADLNHNPAGYPTTTARDYSISLTSLEPNPPGLSVAGSGLSYNSFSTSISGVFGFTPTTAVPEPGTVAMLIGLGTSGSLLGLRRLRRR
jgi:hypothetical protein